MGPLTESAAAQGARKVDQLLAHYSQSHRNPRNDKIEGRKPSFFEDLQYLWVGPLFVLSKLFERLGMRW